MKGLNANDDGRIKARQTAGDGLIWKTHARVRKFRGTRREGNLEAEPYEVIEGEGNLAVNGGIQLLLDLLIGAGGTVYSNANAGLAVGTSATAADPTDTGLGSELDRKGMEATYPSRAGNVLTFVSVFDDAGSDGAWAEWGIFNNPTTGGTMLNHKIQSFGTKSGGSWELTATFTPS